VFFFFFLRTGVLDKSGSFSQRTKLESQDLLDQVKIQ